MRAIPLTLLLLMTALPLAAAAPVADDGCTHVRELVHACTSTNGNGDPCAEAWISRQPPIVDACVPLSALVGELCAGRVCVYQGENGLCVGGEISHAPFEHCVGKANLATAAAAPADYPCVYYNEGTWVCTYTDSTGATCVGGEIGGRPWRYCVSPRVDAAAPADAACEPGQTGACTYRDARGNTCYRVQLGWHTVADECFIAQAATAGPEYPCVYVDQRTFVCAYRNADGEQCVGGAIAWHFWSECLGRAQTTSATYPCVYASADVWVCYDAGCVEGMWGHYPVGYCLPDTTVAVAEPCLPGDLACVEREGGRVCVVYRTGDLEDPRRACIGR